MSPPPLPPPPMLQLDDDDDEERQRKKSSGDMKTARAEDDDEDEEPLPLRSEAAEERGTELPALVTPLPPPPVPVPLPPPISDTIPPRRLQGAVLKAVSSSSERASESGTTKPATAGPAL